MDGRGRARETAADGRGKAVAGAAAPNAVGASGLGPQASDFGGNTQRPEARGPWTRAVQRQRDAKLGAVAGDGVPISPRCARRGPARALDHRQPQARPRRRPAGVREEAAEDVALVLGRDPGAVVAHRGDQPAGVRHTASTISWFVAGCTSALSMRLRSSSAQRRWFSGAPRSPPPRQREAPAGVARIAAILSAAPSPAAPRRRPARAPRAGTACSRRSSDSSSSIDRRSRSTDWSIGRRHERPPAPGSAPATRRAARPRRRWWPAGS